MGCKGTRGNKGQKEEAGYAKERKTKIKYTQRQTNAKWQQKAKGEYLSRLAAASCARKFHKHENSSNKI